MGQSESKYGGPGRSEVSANEPSSPSAFLPRTCAAKGIKNVCVLLTQEGAILDSALLLIEVVVEPGLDVSGSWRLSQRIEHKGRIDLKRKQDYL